MKKIGQLYREAFEKELTALFKENRNFFFINYSGLSASKMSELRNNLKQLGACLFISKNTISRKVFEKLKLNKITEFINGPLGMIFVGDDIISVSKILTKFKKEEEKLDFLGGFWQDKKIAKETLKDISLLPPKQVLAAICFGLIKSPITNLAIVLNKTLSKLVLVLKSVKEKRQGQAN